MAYFAFVPCGLKIGDATSLLCDVLQSLNYDRALKRQESTFSELLNAKK